MSTRPAAPWALALCLFAAEGAQAAPCEAPIRRAEVARCALLGSPEVRKARQELDVIAGRRRAAGLWLPANPVVSVALAGRIPPTRVAETSTLNWYVTLAQEVEIAGQRGARLERVDAEAAAQVRRVAVAEQDVMALALSSYFEALGARATLALTARLDEVARMLGSFADERAKSALIAPVDADLIKAEVIRVTLLHQEAARRVLDADAQLATLLGRDPTIDLPIAGDLATDTPAPEAEVPPAAHWVDLALALRGELAAVEMERRMLKWQLAVLRRSRAPNVTLSAYAQRDGFDEQVYGGSLSVPIPLPAPVGHIHRGEILETSARLAQAGTSLELIRRRVREEVVRARANERSRAAALALYSADLLGRADTDLKNLKEGIISRQLSVRDALLAQRTLIELLLGHVETRLRYALAWVELRRAAGMLTTDEVGP